MVIALAALVPPWPSVPPGAGNEPKKPIKPRKRAKNIKEGYVDQAERFDGDVHAAAICRRNDSDPAAIPGVEPAQCGLHVAQRANPAACRQSSRDRIAVNHEHGDLEGATTGLGPDPRPEA